jgi:hypothetical protein
MNSDKSPQAFRKNSARLNQKIYNVNPLLCANCLGSIRIISLIDDAEIIKKVLKHLDLWDVKRKSPTQANDPPSEAFITLKNTALGKSAGGGSKFPKRSIQRQKNNFDNKTRFSYQEGYCLY